MCRNSRREIDLVQARAGGRCAAPRTTTDQKTNKTTADEETGGTETTSIPREGNIIDVDISI